MSWNQDLRCTSQETNPSPIHLFKILLPKFIHRVVFHYITQIIISDFKDFRWSILKTKKPDSSSFYAIQPFLQIKVNQQRLFKKCSQSKEFILILKISPTTFFICSCNSDSKKPLFNILLKDMNGIDECCEVLKFLVI